MTLIRTCLAVGLLAFLFAPGVSVAQGTPDRVTPAVEAMCSKVRGGAAGYGLCVAYCEANDCDLEPGTRECAKLRERYAAVTGSSTFPCDGELK